MKLKSRSRSRGFTLIEMLIVIVVMGVLLALAIPNYTTTITRSKEARLHHNLTTINNVIQQYSLDKKHAPLQLDDLVTEGYLKSIPDDITGSNTWVTEQEDPEKAWKPDELGITAVHSGSDQTALDGSAYSSWTK
jgi:general secretion pathway protein G